MRTEFTVTKITAEVTENIKQDVTTLQLLKLCSMYNDGSQSLLILEIEEGGGKVKYRMYKNTNLIVAPCIFVESLQFINH